MPENIGKSRPQSLAGNIYFIRSKLLVSYSPVAQPDIDKGKGQSTDMFYCQFPRSQSQHVVFEV